MLFDYDYIETKFQEYINEVEDLEDKIKTSEVFDKLNEIVQEAAIDAPDNWVLESENNVPLNDALVYFSVTYYEPTDVNLSELPEIKILNNKKVLVN